MSFNSFPIPDILDRLKDPKVDDAIKDVAEKKHVYNGPMRLSPGRLYTFYIHVKTKAVLHPSEAGSIFLNVAINDGFFISTQAVNTPNVNYCFVGSAYVSDGKIFSYINRGSGSDISSNQPFNASAYIRVLDSDSFTLVVNGTYFEDNFDIIDFLIVEV